MRRGVQLKRKFCRSEGDNEEKRGSSRKELSAEWRPKLGAAVAALVVAAVGLGRPGVPKSKATGLARDAPSTRSAPSAAVSVTWTGLRVTGSRVPRGSVTGVVGGSPGPARR